MNNSHTSDRLIALVGTIAFHAAIVAILLMTWLFPSMPEAEKALVADMEESEILLGSEYVIAGDVDILSDDRSANEPATSVTEQAEAASREASDLKTAGDAGETAPLVSSTRPSEMKTPSRPTPEKTGPDKKADEERKAAERAAAERAERISKRTNFAADNSSDSPKGNTGSPDGNADHGTSAGTPGYYLAGRTVASWSYPSATATGTIVINVKVNRQGHVTQATYGKGNGPVASSDAARRSCIAAAKASRFSVIEDGPAEQSGTITYRFR